MKIESDMNELFRRRIPQLPGSKSSWRACTGRRPVRRESRAEGGASEAAEGKGMGVVIRKKGLKNLKEKMNRRNNKTWKNKKYTMSSYKTSLWVFP
jgi:hypothetical protein